MVEAQLVAPCRLPEINLLNRAPVRHNRTCENHCGKGEKKAYGQCERNACGGGHRCTPSIRQWTKTDITLCLRVKCEGPHTCRSRCRGAFGSFARGRVSGSLSARCRRSKAERACSSRRRPARRACQRGRPR